MEAINPFEEVQLSRMNERYTNFLLLILSIGIVAIAVMAYVEMKKSNEIFEEEKKRQSEDIDRSF